MLPAESPLPNLEVETQTRDQGSSVDKNDGLIRNADNKFSSR